MNPARPALARRLGQVGGAVLATGAGVVAYGSLWERTAFTLRQARVPTLPPGTAPLLVLHLSDAHMRPGQHRKQAWLRDLARLQPDLVVLTGDSLGGAGGAAAMLHALDPLLERPGVFVLGSNDYYGPRPKNPLAYFRRHHRRVLGDPLRWEELVSGLTERGWHDLTNARLRLRIGDVELDLRGVDDPHLRRDRLDLVAGPAAPGCALRLGVVHAPEPRVLEAFAADGVDLALAGHTHGGQVRVPMVGALVTNCGLDRARCRGLSGYPDRAAGPMWLHVSAGLGTSVYAPLRVACRPEATLLTLTQR